MRTALVGAILFLGGCVVEARAGSGPAEPGPAVANNPPPPPPRGNNTPPPAPVLGTPVRTPAQPNVNNKGTIPNNPAVFGVLDPSGGALKGTLYWIPTDTMNFPDVTKLQPQGTIYTNQLAVPMHDFNEGFPGVANRTEWFAIRYEGSFTVGRAGEYGFELVSDDGSLLYIDGNLVINNDGRHTPQPPKDGKAMLTAGTHTIRVDYFKSMRWVVALELYVVPPGGQKKYWSPAL